MQISESDIHFVRIEKEELSFQPSIQFHELLAQCILSLTFWLFNVEIFVFQQRISVEWFGSEKEEREHFTDSVFISFISCTYSYAMQFSTLLYNHPSILNLYYKIKTAEGYHFLQFYSRKRFFFFVLGNQHNTLCNSFFVDHSLRRAVGRKRNAVKDDIYLCFFMA